MVQPNTIKWVGGFLIALASWFSLGYHHPDEYFQIFEFASWRAGITPAEDLPWEFNRHMRPTLQPSLVWATIKISEGLGWLHPFYLMTFFRFLAGLLFFTTALSCWNTFAGDFFPKTRQTIVLFLALLLYTTPYLAVRFSSENVSGCLLFLSLALLKDAEKKSSGRLLAAGALLGLSFHARYQIAFAMLGLGLWMLVRYRRALRVPLLTALGALIGLGGGLLLDAWFYGKWVLPPYTYYLENIVHQKAAAFGVKPWYYYLKNLAWGPLLAVGPFVIMGYLLLLLRFPGHAFTAISLPFLLAHSLVGHKELRFLFPMYLLVPYLLGLAMEFLGRLSGLKKWGQALLKPALGVNFLLMGWTVFLPPSDNFWFLKNLYEFPLPRGATVVFDEEHHFLSPYDDGALKFTFLQPRQRQLQFVPLVRWLKLGSRPPCTAFITKVGREQALLRQAEPRCGLLRIAYQNLYAPLLRKIREEGFHLPPDVRAYVIYVPDSTTAL